MHGFTPRRRGLVFAAALLLFLYPLPFGAQDLADFVTGSVTSVSTQKNQADEVTAINVKVEVELKDGTKIPFDQYLSAENRTLWLSGKAGQEKVARQMMLAVLDRYQKEQAAKPVSSTTATKEAVAISADETALQQRKTEIAAEAAAKVEAKGESK